MRIIWTDTNLKKHELDLSKAVSVKIDAVSLSKISADGGITVTTDDVILIKPLASNTVFIFNKET
jgi:hypothetical protein